MFLYFSDNYTWSSAVYLALMAGGQLGEFDRQLAALRSVEATPEAWNGAWKKLADQGERQVPPGTEKMDTYRGALRAFGKAIEHTPLELERVEIESPDGSLPGYLIRAQNLGKRPIVIFYSGFDVVKELLYVHPRRVRSQRHLVPCCRYARGRRTAPSTECRVQT